MDKWATLLLLVLKWTSSDAQRGVEPPTSEQLEAVGECAKHNYYRCVCLGIRTGALWLRWMPICTEYDARPLVTVASEFLAYNFQRAPLSM